MYKFSFEKYLEWCRKNNVEPDKSHKEMDGELVLTASHPQQFYLLFATNLSVCEIPSEWCENVPMTSKRFDRLMDMKKACESIKNEPA